jgi:phosphopantetheinyl transferase
MNTPWPDRVLVLEGTADRALFTDDELATADEFKLPKRRDEWLLSRAAAKQLSVQRGIAADPRRVSVARPFIANTRWYVSLSHSMPYAAAAIDCNPVGIDIQVVREIPEWSTHLFLSREEDEAMRRCTIPHRVLHFWCAKEAAFKQRSDEFKTMKQCPVTLVRECESGVSFDVVETVAIGEVIVAVTRNLPSLSRPAPLPSF